MDNLTFQALQITEANEQFKQSMRTFNIKDLPDGDVLIKVIYSSLNYKDALSASGNRGVTRQYPHVPGIDAAGIVVESRVGDFKPGDQVIANGFDLGMNTHGGFSEYIRIPASWCVRLPKGLSLAESMMLGTAGLAAGMSVFQLIKHGLKPEDGEILVTGATGGVGSLATAILAKLGYAVVAATRKESFHEFLLRAGAQRIISSEKLLVPEEKGLAKEFWSGVVDTISGPYLGSVLKCVRYGGAATCCGQVASPQLNTTIYPFILRGITLYGIDAVAAPSTYRQMVWKLLSEEWKPTGLAEMVREVNLADIGTEIEQILSGGQVGRVLIRVSSDDQETPT